MIEPISKAIGSSVERAPWGWLLTLAVVSALIKGWPAIVDATARAKAALGDRRVSRIEKLEAKIEEQRVSYEAEIGILRHDLNNVSSCLDALLLLLETAPEKAVEHVSRIKAMREKQAISQSAEKATIRAARIVAAGVAVKGDAE